MKGIIVKYKDIVCKAGIPHCGTLFTADITWHSGAYWSVGGLKMPEEQISSVSLLAMLQSV